VENLYTTIQQTPHTEELKNEWQQQLNKLDWQVTNLMLNSEKTQCLKKNAAYWSPTIQQSKLVVRYWKKLNKARQNHKPPHASIRKIWDKMDPTTKQQILDCAVSIKSALKRACKQHRNNITNHWKH
jgi:hypothetical protein